MVPVGRLVMAVGLTLAVAGCSTPLSTREKGAIGGAAVGAGAGAVIGSASGHTGTGALIGAGVGAVSGALIGDAIQSSEQPQAAPPPPAPQPAPPVSAPPTPPPPARVAVAPPPPVVVQAPQYVWVPEWGVYVLEGHDIVYHDGHHYRYYESYWFVSRSYAGPWAYTASPPRVLAAVPPGHFHKQLPPGLAKKGKVPPGHMR